MAKGWKSFELHVRKSLYCCEQTTKGNSGEDSEEDTCRESLSVLREYLSGCEQNVGRNVDSKGHSDEVSDGNEEHVIGNYRKGHLYYKVSKNLPEFCHDLVFGGRQNL